MSYRVVAIDARWLWDRDTRVACPSAGGATSRDRCSMAVGSRRVTEDRVVRPPRRRRDRCSMAVGSRQGRVDRRFASLPGRDRCSMAVGSRPGLLLTNLVTICQVAIDAR